MSTDRDTTRIVRSWLRLDEHESADRVLDAVLDRLNTTPQRRTTWWPARRLPEMNSFLKLGVAVAVAAVAVLLGFNYFIAPKVGGPGPGLDDPSPTQDPTTTPAAETTHEVTPNGLPDLTLTVTIPSDWAAFEDWAFDGPNGAASPSGAGIGFWGIANLYADPLDRNAGLAERFGPAVADLVDALVRHPGWTATEPTPVTIHGYAGQYLEVTVPDVTFGDCDPDNGFWMWTTPTAGQRCAQGPGQIHHMWVLDVDGERLVIAGLSFPDTAEADREAVIAIAESAQIERGP